jgi:hypothetical protein
MLGLRLQIEVEAPKEGRAVLRIALKRIVSLSQILTNHQMRRSKDSLRDNLTLDKLKLLILRDLSKCTILGQVLSPK